MYPYIHLIIPSYAAMALIGGLVSITYAFFRIDKYDVQFTDFLKILLFGSIGVLLGSKILFVITKIPWLLKNFTISNMLLLIPESGYVFYGGLFGFIFIIYMITKSDNEYRKKLYMLFVPIFPLFHVFGRIGCFLAGCCYGKKLNTIFVVLNIEIDTVPIQLIEALLELFIFLIICVVENHKEDINLLEIYLLLYASVRFVLEFFRGDEIRGMFYGLSTSQWISIVIVLFYLIKNIGFLWKKSKWLCQK